MRSPVSSHSRRTGRTLVVVGTFGSALSQWIIVLLIARLSGASEVGIYSVILAFATPIYVAGQLGLRDILLSLRRRPPFRVFLYIGTAGGLTSTLLFVIAGHVQGWPLALIWAFVALKVSTILNDLLLGAVQAQDNMWLLGSAMIANATFTIGLTAIALLATRDLSLAILSSALVTLAISVVLLRYLKSTPIRADVLENHPVQTVLRASFPVTLAQLLSSLLVYMPVLILDGYAADEVIGRYSSAAYLVVFGNLVGASIATVMIPSLRRLYLEEGAHQVRSRLSSVSIRIVLVAAFGLIIVVLLGNTVLSTIYGPTFTLSHIELFILGVAAMSAPIGYIFNMALLVTNQYWWQLPVVALALAMATVAGVGMRALDLDPLLAACVIAAIANAGRAIGFGVGAVLATRMRTSPIPGRP